MISQQLWKWPDGLVWKLTHRLTVGSRRKKFQIFLRQIRPTPTTSILDVGVSGAARAERAENFLEEWYEHPEMITAVGIDDLTAFKKRYPRVRIKQTDGATLPFADRSFDVVFSNAVIEHVGGRRRQQAFVAECLRVGKQVFLTTPSRSFPIESHTMIPFAHWLPTDLRNVIYYLFGRKNEGRPGALTLLTARSFRRLFPVESNVRIVRQRLLGLTSVLIAISRRR